MPRLADVTTLIRSKNAGPFLLTFDVMFKDRETYERVRDTNFFSVERLSDLFGLPVKDIEIFHYDPGLAIKATIPRPVFSGDLGDTDLMGGQQYAALVELELP